MSLTPRWAAATASFALLAFAYAPGSPAQQGPPTGSGGSDDGTPPFECQCHISTEWHEPDGTLPDWVTETWIVVRNPKNGICDDEDDECEDPRDCKATIEVFMEVSDPPDPYEAKVAVTERDDPLDWYLPELSFDEDSSTWSCEVDFDKACGWANDNDHESYFWIKFAAKDENGTTHHGGTWLINCDDCYLSTETTDQF